MIVCYLPEQVKESEVVLDILNLHEAVSGQKINLKNFEVTFSRNISLNLPNFLHVKLNFTAVTEHRKYFGLPTYIRRSKKIVFQIIQDRVGKR